MKCLSLGIWKLSIHGWRKAILNKHSLQKLNFFDYSNDINRKSVVCKHRGVCKYFIIKGLFDQAEAVHSRV